MVRVVPVRVSATATATVIKVSSSFLTAHSPLVRRYEQRWLRAVVSRHISADVDADSGHAYRP